MSVISLLQGDSLSILKTLESDSIDCCITSPPYWALRDYKTEGQLGLEAIFEEYISKLIEIFSEVKRVLKKTGTCWIILGDTYAGVKVGNTNNAQKKGVNTKSFVKQKQKQIPDKSLCMIPSRFAIAMIDNGWILRNDIIWHKPNCMPSSAKDRFTIDYEHIFFFVKSQKYWFETQYEPYSPVTLKEALSSYNGKGIKDYDLNNVQNPSDVKRRILSSINSNKRVFGGSKYGGVKMKNKKQISFGGNKAEGYGPATYSGKEWNPSSSGRLKRAVWRVNTSPFRDAHFAVFPEKLVEPMIKSGCPEGGLVLDCFAGAGTVGLVASKNNRRFIGIELNPSYVEMATKRLEPYIKQQKLLM